MSSRTFVINWETAPAEPDRIFLYEEEPDGQGSFIGYAEFGPFCTRLELAHWILHRLTVAMSPPAS